MVKALIYHHEDWEQDRFEAALEHEAALTFVHGALSEHTLPDDATAEVLSVFVDSEVTAEVIAHFPRLRLIATRSTGFDHIDLNAAQAHDVAVCNVPSYGEHTVAEHAFALLLSLSKRIVDGYEQVREAGNFNPHALRGFDLSGKTLGVIGTGRIGRHAVRIGRGFDMRVIANDAHPDEAFAQEVGCSYVSLAELLAHSDVLTLHVPYLPETHHLINRENIRQLKKGAVIINTSRGAVIETQALIEALEAGTLFGAGLDVLEEEGVVKDELAFLAGKQADEHNLKTIVANHVLIDHPNVIVTPHSAFNTREALERIVDTTIRNIERFLDGMPEHVVS